MRRENLGLQVDGKGDSWVRVLTAAVGLLAVIVLSLAGLQQWRQLEINNRLVMAAENPSTSEAQMKLLLRRGANPNARKLYLPRLALNAVAAEEFFGWMSRADRRNGLTPLCAAADWGRADLVRVLLAAGADPRVPCGEGFGSITPLMVWSQSWEAPSAGLETARLLLDHGADVNAPSANGLTPLMLAVGFHRAPAIRLLLSRGADPNAADRRGRTALWHCISNRKTDSVRALLEYGANVNARAADGLTPYGKALRSKTPKSILELLRRAGATE